MIAGCDFSTKAVDFVKLDIDSNDVQWRRITLEGWDHGAFAATLRVRDKMSSMRSWWDDVTNLYLEEPHGWNARTADALGMITGAIVASVPAPTRYEMAFSRIHVKTWRQKLMGNGNATKPEVVAHLQNLGFDLRDAPVDAYEALGVAYVAREEIMRVFGEARPA